MNEYLLIVILLIAAVVLFCVARFWLKRKRDELRSGLQFDTAMAGGELLVPPQKASFRGATQRYGKVKNDGAAFLTSETFVFRPLFGKNVIKIGREEIRSYREDLWFLTARHGNKKHLILKLQDGTETGFFFIDNEQWKEALDTML